MSKVKCQQVCPFNTLSGCKVEEYSGICPMSNSVRLKEKPKTNADRIRAMSDEELAMNFEDYGLCKYIQRCDFPWCEGRANCSWCVTDWLKQPANEVASDVLMQPDGEEV